MQLKMEVEIFSGNQMNRKTWRIQNEKQVERLESYSLDLIRIVLVLALCLELR